MLRNVCKAAEGIKEALNKGAYAEWYLLNGKALK